MRRILRGVTDRPLLPAVLLFGFGLIVLLARMGLLREAGSVRLGADWALTDFYSAAYHPTRAVLDGSTPYARDGSYPPYAPLHLVLHLPFAVLPEEAAGAAYFVFGLLLTVVVAHLALRLARVPSAPHRTVLVAAVLLLSRPGHWTLLLGQVSLLLTAAVYLVFLADRERSLRGATSLAVALLKPTYGLVLALLLWAWGRGPTAALGLALATLVNLPLLALLAAREGGVPELIAAAAGGYRAWQAIPDVNPATSSTRTDAIGLVSRVVGEPLSDEAQLLLSAAILLPTVLALRVLRDQRRQEGRDVAVAIAALAINLVGFHRAYDLVLLTAPVVALASGRPAAPPVLRWLMLGLFAVPALNWLATESVIAAWQPSRPAWLLVSSASTLAVVGLLVAYLWLGLRRAGRTVPAVVAPGTAW